MHGSIVKECTDFSGPRKDTKQEGCQANDGDKVFNDGAYHVTAL